MNSSCRNTSQSKSLSHRQERSLLEEWPHVSIRNSEKKKAVSFSKYASLKVFEIDAKERSSMSYSSLDRKAFRIQAQKDVMDIKDLIESCPCEGGRAIQYLFNNDILQPEELLGIESLIMNAERVAAERKKHNLLVVKAQEVLQRTNEAHLDMKLGCIATKSSFKSIEKGWMRAALAATAEQKI